MANAAATSSKKAPQVVLPLVDTSCASCGKLGAEQRCARCKDARYCGTDCQRTHWKEGGHKAVCVAANTGLIPTLALLRSYDWDGMFADQANLPRTPELLQQGGLQLIKCRTAVELKQKLRLDPTAYPCVMHHLEQSSRISDSHAEVFAEYVAGGGVLVIFESEMVEHLHKVFPNLQWARGDYYRSNVAVTGAGRTVLDIGCEKWNPGQKITPAAMYSNKASYCRNVPEEEAIYQIPRDAKHQGLCGKMGLAGDAPDPDICSMMAHRHGRGFLVCCGDVNSEVESFVALANICTKLAKRHWTAPKPMPSPLEIVRKLLLAPSILGNGDAKLMFRGELDGLWDEVPGIKLIELPMQRNIRVAGVVRKPGVPLSTFVKALATASAGDAASGGISEFDRQEGVDVFRAISDFVHCGGIFVADGEMPALVPWRDARFADEEPEEAMVRVTSHPFFPIDELPATVECISWGHFINVPPEDRLYMYSSADKAQCAMAVRKIGKGFIATCIGGVYREETKHVMAWLVLQLRSIVLQGEKK